MKISRSRLSHRACSVILIAFVFGHSLCSAQDEQVAELQAEITELKTQIEEEEAKLEASAQAQANIEMASKAVSLAQVELPPLEKEIEKMEYLIEAYQSAFRVTASVAPGERLGTATLVSGGVVTDAIFNATTKGGIAVQTASGVITIPSSDVPVAWAGRFKLPPVIATSTQTIAKMRADKPAAAMGSAEKLAAQGAAKLALKEGKAAEVIAAAQAKEASKADENTAYNDMVKRNQARFDEIERLRAEYKVVDSKLAQVRQGRSREQAELQSAKVKQAPSQIEKALGRYDSQIRTLEDERLRLRDEVEKLRQSME